jgi:hypothetical protein
VVEADARRVRHPQEELSSRPPPPKRSLSPMPESAGRVPVSVDPRSRSEYAAPQTAWSRIADKAIDKLGVPLVAAVVAAGGVGAFMSRKEPPKVPDRGEEIGKLRDCVQKQGVWIRRSDRMYRAVLGQLGAGVQGAQYPEVEFFPAPLSKTVKPDAAPAVQPVETLPPPPVCEF